MRRLFVLLGVAAVGALILGWWLKGRDAGPAKTATPVVVTSGGAKQGAAARAPAKPASVSGRVTKKADGSAVADAIVSIARAELGGNLDGAKTPAIVATTDANGAWSAQVPPGDYLIAATARGLLPASRDKLAIASDEKTSGIDFALEAGGTQVRGTVSDVGGGPIASARVTAKQRPRTIKAGAEFVVLTAADGTYELSLPDEVYRLTAEHDDYTSSTKVADVAGKPITQDFTLIPGGTIRGQVIARDTRKPVANALVEAQGGVRGNRGRDITAIADAEGRFVLRGLTSGATQVKARGRGYASASPTIVQIGIGESIEDVQVLVDGAYSISGRVLKKGTTTGVAGAHVGVFSMSGGGQGDSPDPTDATGAFEIFGVRPGSYMLYAAAEGNVLEIGKNVQVVDTDVTDIVVELSTGVTLSGRVEPPMVATIGLELDAEVGIANMFEMVKTVLVRGESDASGAFTLASVPAGKLRVVASTKDGTTGKLPIVVADVDQKSLVVQMKKKASIAGRVIDTNGKPVAGVNVEAKAVEDKPMSFSTMMMDRSDRETAADGSFKIVGLEAGKYEVGVRDFDDMLARAKDKAKGTDKKKTVVDVADGAEKTGVTVTVEARDGVLRGVVVGADGKPAADAWVTARREMDMPDLPAELSSRMSFNQSDPILTGEGGKFVIERLKKGTYTIVAEGPRGSSRGEKKGIKTGDSATITLAALGTLVVTVKHAGAPLKEYDLACDSTAHDVERHAATEDGVYTVENLAPAEYECKVHADTGTGEGKVTVASGENKLEIALNAWASISGSVVSVLDGKPVPGLTVIAGEGTRQFIDAMTGGGPKTDAQGKFVVEKVSAGKGRVMLIGKDASMSNMESREYTAESGKRTDVGVIKIIPPRTTEAGTFGFSLEAKGDVLEVTDVVANGPAAAAGVVVGDKIVSVEGQPLKQLTAETARKLLSSGTVGIGQTYKLGLERGPVTITSVKW